MFKSNPALFVAEIGYDSLVDVFFLCFLSLTSLNSINTTYAEEVTSQEGSKLMVGNDWQLSLDD
jgi:hypothetical protein